MKDENYSETSTEHGITYISIVQPIVLSKMPMQITEFSPSAVDFNFFKATDNKKRVYINKGKGIREGVQLQLCEALPESMMRAPFGISEPMQGAVDNGRFSMEVAVDCEATGNKFKEMDDVCIKYAHAESTKCFGKQLELNTIRDRFVSPFREFACDGKSNLLRLKISDKCQVLCMHTYDAETKSMKARPGDKSSIQRGSMLVPSVELSPLWFVSGDKQFGYSLHITNVIVDETNSAGGGSRPKNMGAAAFILAEGFNITVDEAPEQPASRKRTADQAGLDGNNTSLDIDGALEADSMAVDPNAYL